MPNSQSAGDKTWFPVSLIALATLLAIGSLVAFANWSNESATTFPAFDETNAAPVDVAEATVIPTPSPAPLESAGTRNTIDNVGQRRDREPDNTIETPTSLPAATVPPEVAPLPTPLATPTPQIDPGAPLPCPRAEPNSTLATAVRIQLAPNTERTCEVVLVGGEDRDLFTITDVRVGETLVASVDTLQPDQFQLQLWGRDGEPLRSDWDGEFLPEQISVYVPVDGPVSFSLTSAGFVRRDLEDEPVHSSPVQETMRLTLIRMVPTPTPVPSPTPVPTAIPQPVYVDDGEYVEPECYWKGGNEHDPDDGYIWCE